MRILITGVAGMIGSNLARALLREGFQVVGVDNFWRGKQRTVEMVRKESPQDFSFFNLDLREQKVLDPIIHEVDHVFHLADVVAGINYVFSNEFTVWSDNVRINSNVLQSVISTPVPPSLTYVGTACSYPQELTMIGEVENPLQEQQVLPANPESSYGWSKLVGELEIGYAVKDVGLSAAILRLDNVYGYPTELTPERSQVIPALIRKAEKYPSEPFVVWGSGKQRRSFIHVDDVVQALLATISKGLGLGPINIGPGFSTSIGQVAEEIVKISGKKIEPVFDATKPEGDSDRSSDLSKARSLLGWEPTVPLQDGLARLYEQIRWYLKKGS